MLPRIPRDIDIGKHGIHRDEESRRRHRHDVRCIAVARRILEAPTINARPSMYITRRTLRSPSGARSTRWSCVG